MSTPLVRKVGALLAWWLVLFWLWLLVAGEWNRQEWIAAALAAAVGAAVAETVRHAARPQGRLPLRWVGRAWSAPLTVPVDFGILVLALGRSLIRGRVVRGRYVARPLEEGRTEAETAGIRAWVTLTASLSPNAYVVETEDGTVLLHDLVPSRQSESPA